MLTSRSGDRWIRSATAGVVTMVAALAAVVSYSHLFDMARSHGEAGVAARLLFSQRRWPDRGCQPGHAPRGSVGPVGTVPSSVVDGAGGPRHGARQRRVRDPVRTRRRNHQRVAGGVVHRERRDAHGDDQAGEGTRGIGSRTYCTNGHDPLVTRFKPYLERGQVPGVRAIKKEMRVGQGRAQEVRDRLAQVLAPPSRKCF